MKVLNMDNVCASSRTLLNIGLKCRTRQYLNFFKNHSLDRNLFHLTNEAFKAEPKNYAINI